MRWWHQLTAVVVINDIPEDEEGVVQQHPPTPPPTKKKEKVEKPPPEEDPLYAGAKYAPSCRDNMLYNRWYHLAYVMLLCIFLGLLLPFILTSTALKPSSKVLDQRGYCFLNDSIKYACRGGYETEKACIEHGCCYEKVPNPLIPLCFHSEPSEYGYTVNSSSIEPIYSTFTKQVVREDEIVSEIVETASYRLGDSESMRLDLASLTEKTPYDTAMWPAELLVERGGDDIIRLTISSPGRDEGTLMKDPTFSGPSVANSRQLEVEVTQVKGEPFNVTVYRNNTGEMLFRTLLGPFIIGDGHMELTTTLPSSRVYGLGSRFNTLTNPMFGNFENWTLNSMDPSFSNQSLPDTHPFYMCSEPSSGKVHGVYLRSSTPLQIGTVPAPGIAFRSAMGSFKILVMAGPNPRDVSLQYASMMGFPQLPPFWAFGFHLCRTVDVKDQEEAYKAVRDGMSINNLPYDSDCLDARLSYPDPYSALPDWTDVAMDELHGSNRKFLIATYPFLVHETDTFNDAQQKDVLMKLPRQMAYFGEVSGSAVGYPDYMDENSYDNWLSKSAEVSERFKLADGVLLLQNSPLNQAVVAYNNVTMYNLSCTAEHPEHCCSRPDTAFNMYPDATDVSNGTICWTAIHASLAGSRHLAHHNAYGMYHTKRVHDIMKNIHPSSRPVLVSSSTHPESGQFGGQLSEGFGLSVAEQQRALQLVIQAGLAGMPFAGPPPCGTRNDTEVGDSDEWEKLCLRSYQMSLFFPFFMSHYQLGQTPTNPPDVSDGFATMLKRFILLRYTLLPTLYTLAEEASREGTPIIRPLFYEFPQDEASHEVSDQFMVGSSVLVVPNFLNTSIEDMSHATQAVPAYMPPGCWYNLFSGQDVGCSSNGSVISLPTVFSDVNAFLRGGHALFMQGNVHENIQSSEDSRAQDYTVVAAAPEEEEDIVQCCLYYDDGVTPISDPGGFFATFLNASISREGLTVTRLPVPQSQGHYCRDQHNAIEAAMVYGLNREVEQVTVEGKPHTSFTQNPTTGVLSVQDLHFDWCANNSQYVIKWTFVPGTTSPHGNGTTPAL